MGSNLKVHEYYYYLLALIFFRRKAGDPRLDPRCRGESQTRMEPDLVILGEGDGDEA